VANLTKGQKARLGVFVAAGLTVLIGATLMLAGRALTEKRDTYKIRFSSKAASFSGLSVGSDVTYSGIKIGRVEELNVAPDNVSVIAVSISVTHGTPIATDSKASLGSQGITGMKYVDISRGSPHLALRKPGDFIPPGDSFMDSLTERAASIGEKLDDLLKHLQEMTGAKAQASVTQILEQSAGLLTDNRENIAAIIANVRKTSEELAGLAQESRQVAVHADALVLNLTETANELHRSVGPKSEIFVAMGKVEKLLDSLNLVIGRSQADIDVTLRHLRDASADLSDFAQAVKENPTLLMFNADNRSDRKIGK
jgi:phospholipid/cholesterol/gamma-HCH transport system substrate-binding protein